MLERRELFPNVIELNFQARRRLGCCVYLIFSGSDWMLLDIGYTDTAEEPCEPCCLPIQGPQQTHLPRKAWEVRIEPEIVDNKQSVVRHPIFQVRSKGIYVYVH